MEPNSNTVARGVQVQQTVLVLVKEKNRHTSLNEQIFFRTGRF